VLTPPWVLTHLNILFSLTC